MFWHKMTAEVLLTAVILFSLEVSNWLRYLLRRSKYSVSSNSLFTTTSVLASAQMFLTGMLLLSLAVGAFSYIQPLVSVIFGGK